MKPTLFILAAGTGSRYGGLKQIEGLGPNGETLIDYSIYDAVKAGFGKIVIVINRSFEKEFCEIIVDKYKEIVPITLVFQEVDKVSSGIRINEKREKPWGTSHALLMGAEVINEPFGVINADDFYGRESFQLLAGQLRNMVDTQHEYRLISYMAGNTLADTGAVARAVCEIDRNNYLTKIAEQNEVERINGVPSYRNEKGEWVTLTETTRVSMNMWGFTPDVFVLAQKHFSDFLKNNNDNLESEFFIPTLVNMMVVNNEAKVKLIHTPAQWFGITYLKDKPEVMHRIKELVEDDIYPYNLPQLQSR